MMLFWLIIGGMLAAALLCVIPPLLRRHVVAPGDRRELAVAIYRAEQAEVERELKAGSLSAEHYADVQRELERRLVDGAGETLAAPARATSNVARRAGIAALLLALIPSAALVLYMRIGNPVAAAVQNDSHTAQPDGHETSAGSLEVMLSRLAMRLKRAPDDPDGWAMLARSYTVLERHDDAAAAWRRALSLTPRDPQWLADYADALASANNGDLGGEAMQSIRTALAIDPDNPKALALAASAAFDERDYPLAIQLWERLEKVSAAGSEVAVQVRKNIDETRRLAAADSTAGQASAEQAAGPASPARATTQRNTSSASASLEVHVRLSPEMSQHASPTDYVFVYARAANGPRMPLAVQRLRVSQLPATVRLDDSMAMAPGLTLSAFNAVTVEAHVSASGDAQATPGDLIGHSAPVESCVDCAVTVVIGDVVR